MCPGAAFRRNLSALARTHRLAYPCWLYRHGCRYYCYLRLAARISDLVCHLSSAFRRLIIGAFFMATDWVTSPITKKGRLIYALGLGILTALIRLRGGYVEGVCYSILIMNMVTPLIDRYVTNVPFGGGARHE